MTSHQLAKFGGYRHCGSADIMILVCHKTSQNHVIKESCDFIGRSPLRQVTIMPSLIAIDTQTLRYNGFSLSRDLTRSRDQRVMWLYWQEPIKVSYHPAKFGGHWHSSSGDVFSLSSDLDVMTSPVPAWSVLFESNLVDVPACQIWWS